MKLQLELFVEDVERSVAFYTGVLGFEVLKRKEDGYTALAQGEALIALNRRSTLHPSHLIHARPGEPLGRGVEVALLVEDVRATYDRVVARDWPQSTELTHQPWDPRISAFSIRTGTISGSAAKTSKRPTMRTGGWT